MKFNVDIDNAKQSGVYIIRNTINSKVYIGSARVLFNRFHAHRTTLTSGKHASAKLQSFVNTFGIECLEFNIIELCPVDSLVEREQFYINTLQAVDNGFNKSRKAYSSGRKRINPLLKKTSRTLCVNNKEWDNLILLAQNNGYDGPSEFIVAKFKLDKA